jgi:hypothetical protein
MICGFMLKKTIQKFGEKSVFRDPWAYRILTGYQFILFDHSWIPKAITHQQANKLQHLLWKKKAKASDQTSAAIWPDLPPKRCSAFGPFSSCQCLWRRQKIGPELQGTALLYCVYSFGRAMSTKSRAKMTCVQGIRRSTCHLPFYTL